MEGVRAHREAERFFKVRSKLRRAQVENVEGGDMIQQ